MSLTVQQLLSDARRLSNRLKDHDQSADHLITRSSEVLQEVEGMREYQENIENLNEVAHNRPRAHLVLGIQQENRHIRSLQQENKELRTALEEHQSALELIMSKYRAHITRHGLTNSGGKVEYGTENNSQFLKLQTEKVCEMAAVMKEALKLDIEKEGENQELIARLYTENKGLREMLGISRKHSSLASNRKPVLSIDQGVQTDGQDEDTHINLEITLPLPAPPPRLNKGGANQPEIHKPVSPDLGRDISMSPVDAGNSEASESDETSDDDSIKFDTIKLSRRKTVIPAETGSAPSREPSQTEPTAPATIPTKPQSPEKSSSADLFNKINNNLLCEVPPTHIENSSQIISNPKSDPLVSSESSPSAKEKKSDGTSTTEIRNSSAEKEKTGASESTLVTPKSSLPSSTAPTIDTPVSLETSLAKETSTEKASAPAVETEVSLKAAVTEMALVKEVSSEVSETVKEVNINETVKELDVNVAVTNCESIINDIITQSMNTSHNN